MNQLTTIPQPTFSVRDVQTVAEAIAKGGLFGSKDPMAVLTLCLLAQAEGQHPAVVFRDYHIINGKPAKKAEAMLRDFISAGGKIEWHTLDDETADATFSHPSGGAARISWDKKRVQQAGLGGNGMYKKYPRQMLRSRVISEGVRTVFPGATSGLYVEEEVSTFDPPQQADDTPHDPRTGEIIEGTVVQQEPAARQKLDGPHTSKTALRKAVVDLITLVRKAESVEAVDALKAEHKRTINQALRDWPALINGDPNIPEDIGLKGEIEKRREALSEGAVYSGLVEALNQCETKVQLQNFLAVHGDAVDSLDGAESRKFELAYQFRESLIEEMDKVHS